MTLRVDDLRVHYRTLRGEVRALDGVTFDVGDGEILGLAGESGCGKTTLGKSLIRMDGRMRQVGGTVELDGEELPIGDDDAMNRFRFTEVSLIPQYSMSALNPTRKIGRMVAELLDSRGVRTPTVRRAGTPPGPGRAAPRGARQLPDRAVRRHEAADGDGHLHPARPVAAHRRRDDLRARRVDPEGRGQDPRGVPRPGLRAAA